MTSDLIDATTEEQILRTSRSAIGDSLRSVTYFTRDDFQQIYLRDDLEKDADLSTFIGNEWRGFRITTPTRVRNSETTTTPSACSITAFSFG